MTRALVIRTVGDAEMARAIADGMAMAIPLEDGELRAECERLRTRDGLRVYGDTRRFERTRRELARKYATKPHGRAYRAFWGCVGLVIVCVHAVYDRLSEVNRRE